MRWYFNYIYNPLYDFSVARSKPYKRLQSGCLNRLNFKPNESVLCIGTGTGNDISGILDRNDTTVVTGIDTSQKALDRARLKVLRNGNNISLLRMDAHQLDFGEETFDKVLCIHVMGFLEDDRKATLEIVRVLKKGGQLAATYPSGIGSMELGNEIGRDIRDHLRSGRITEAARQVLGSIIGGITYTPASSWVKPAGGFYSYESLNAMLDDMGLSEYQIDEDKAYQDFAVWGKK